jgi:hypothetical protein
MRHGSSEWCISDNFQLSQHESLYPLAGPSPQRDRQMARTSIWIVLCELDSSTTQKAINYESFLTRINNSDEAA